MLLLIFIILVVLLYIFIKKDKKPREYNKNITADSIPDGSWTSEEFEYWNELQYQQHVADIEEFKLENHNIFDDNDLSDIEIKFFKNLTKNMQQQEINPHLLRLNRLGDKTINVKYINYQIGRIKLNGQKTKIQILRFDTVRWIENKTLDEYLTLSDQWVRYIKKELNV